MTSTRTGIVTYRGAVYASHCDHIGHMNIASYGAKFDEANWVLFCEIGLTPSYLRSQSHGMAGVQQNIAYKRELLPGDIVEIRSRLLEIREKSIRFVHEMRNAVTGEISAVCVLTGVSMDSRTRRSCPFPQDIIARARRLVRPYKETP